ncbi:MAG: hypothetical protein QM655_12375 [Nocardioidaceae bacterium]
MISLPTPFSRRFSRPSPRHLPAPLWVAVVVVLLEALGFAVYGVIELFHLDSKRPEVALTAGIFFVLYAGFLVFFGWRLARAEAWARAPIVMAQLIQVAVALNYGGVAPLSVTFVVTAAVVLVGVFHRASIEAIESHESD